MSDKKTHLPGPRIMTKNCAIFPRRPCRLSVIMSTSKLYNLLILKDLQKWDFLIGIISIISLIFGFLSHFRPKRGGQFPYCLKIGPFLDCRFEGGYFQHD